jgi:hypothetical protein
METLINIISHNLTGGIGIGLFVGSLLNWYTIWYYNRHINRIEEQTRYDLRKQINAKSNLQRQIIDMEYKYRKEQIDRAINK